MTTVPLKQSQLPAWLRMAIEEGQRLDRHLNKRSEHRLVWVRLASLQPHPDAPSEKPISVKIANVSSRGVGLISREHLEEGRQLVLSPDGVTEDLTPFETVNVRVVHCTKTIQGYKVGCVFVL